jgi:hypothetical protein
MSHEQHDREAGEVDIGLDQEDRADDNEHPHGEAAEGDHTDRGGTSLARPRKAQRARQEVARDERECRRRAREPVDATPRVGHEQHRRRHQRGSTHEVEADVTLYRRDRVHGFPSSSYSMRARYA